MGRGLPWKQRLRVHVLELLQGHLEGLVVKQPGVLRLRRVSCRSDLGRWLSLPEGFFGDAADVDGAGIALVVPVCASRVPERGLPWKQRVRVHVLELLQGR